MRGALFGRPVLKCDFWKAEEEGFEPSRRVTDLLVFEARPFSRLGTPPDCYLSYNIRRKFSRDFLPKILRACPLWLFMIKFNY